MRKVGRLSLVVVALLAMSGSVLPGQTPATRQLMRAKLDHMQRTLESLMTGDYAQLQSESRALAAITKDPHWEVLKSQRYTRDSTRFEQAAADLAQAAGEKDSESAIRAYVSTTLACYQCHRDVSAARIAK